MEFFATDILQFFNKNRQTLSFGWTAGYSPLNPNISGIFLKLPNFLGSKVVSRSATHEATRTFTFW